jgi:putative glutamine amidotransferase
MKPRIAIPEPCSYDREYSERSLPPYVKAVEAAGGEAVIVPLLGSPEEVARTVSGCDAVLLPGSKADVDPQKYGAENDPHTAPADGPRDSVDELLLQDAYSQKKPIFGICYGLQALNVWRSGTLVQHIVSSIDHSPEKKLLFAHDACLVPGTILEQVVHRSSVLVNSSHHQAAETVGDGLRVSARCPDDRVIEALEGIDLSHYVLAVQWHPERSFEEDVPSRRLFERLIRAAQQWQRGREAR